MSDQPPTGRRAPAKRTQVHPRLPAELGQRLRTFAVGKGSSQGSIIEAALTRYFDGANDGPVIVRRLDRLARAVARVHRDVAVVADVLAIYVKIWLANTPRLPDPEKAKTERAALVRFAQFTDDVAAKVASGRSVMADLVREGEAGDIDPSAASRANREGDRS